MAQHRGRATITTGGQRADRGLLASEVISRRPLPGATRLGEMYLDFSSVYSGPSDHPSLIDEIDKAKNWITAELRKRWRSSLRKRGGPRRCIH